jgi:hypothetical protein
MGGIGQHGIALDFMEGQTQRPSILKRLASLDAIAPRCISITLRRTPCADAALPVAANNCAAAPVTAEFLQECNVTTDAIAIQAAAWREGCRLRDLPERDALQLR